MVCKILSQSMQSIQVEVHADITSWTLLKDRTRQSVMLFQHQHRPWLLLVLLLLVESQAWRTTPSSSLSSRIQLLLKLTSKHNSRWTTTPSTALSMTTTVSTVQTTTRARASALFYSTVPSSSASTALQPNKRYGWFAQQLPKARINLFGVYFFLIAAVLTGIPCFCMLQLLRIVYWIVPTNANIDTHRKLPVWMTHLWCILILRLTWSYPKIEGYEEVQEELLKAGTILNNSTR